MTQTGASRVVLRGLFALGFLGVGLYALQATTAICGSSANDFFETWLYPGLIFLAAGLTLWRAVAVRAERAAWLALGFGLFAWAAGETYYSIFIGDAAPPVPSGADALWLAFYPSCYAAMVLLVRARVKQFHPSLWLDGVLGALAAAALGAALLFGVITGGADPRTAAVDLSYLLGDLLLLGFVVGVFALTGWRPGRAFTILGAALVLSAVVDAYFLYQSATGDVGTTTVVASLWPASTLLAAAAAWQPAVRQETVRLEGFRLLAMPALFGVVALGLLTYHAIESINAAAVTLALVTLGAVIVRMAATFRENLRLLERSRREALSDPLTGLANRRRLMLDLEEAVEDATEEHPVGVMLFDLDGFKLYNDRYGHPLGDSLLARLGSNLQRAVVPGGMAYRLGGDEFCVLASGNAREVERIAAEARAALTERGEGFEITASCGMVLVPQEAGGVSFALHVADERLYAEKGGSKRVAAGRQASDALLEVLKEREPTLPEHLEQVAKMAHDVGGKLGLPPEDLEDLTRAAELHDVGKIAMPEELLRKEGPLEPDEWEFVQQHTVVGDRILSAAPALSSAAKLVRASHERYDGSGYPDGLIAEDIPLGARIVAVCDAYHAMISGRPYRDAISAEDAISELRRCAGSQFDPLVVNAFCDLMERDSASPAGAGGLAFAAQRARPAGA